MINQHGVDCSNIQVGDVVQTWTLWTVVAIGYDNIFADCDSDTYINGTKRIEHDDIEFHYARQPREGE